MGPIYLTYRVTAPISSAARGLGRRAGKACPPRTQPQGRSPGAALPAKAARPRRRARRDGRAAPRAQAPPARARPPAAGRPARRHARRRLPLPARARTGRRRGRAARDGRRGDVEAASPAGRAARRRPRAPALPAHRRRRLGLPRGHVHPGGEGARLDPRARARDALHVPRAGDRVRRLLRGCAVADLRLARPQGRRRRRHLHGGRRLRARARHLGDGRLCRQVGRRLRHDRGLGDLQRALRDRDVLVRRARPPAHLVAPRARLRLLLHVHRHPRRIHLRPGAAHRRPRRGGSARGAPRAPSAWRWPVVRAPPRRGRAGPGLRGLGGQCTRTRCALRPRGPLRPARRLCVGGRAPAAGRSARALPSETGGGRGGGRGLTRAPGAPASAGWRAARSRAPARAARRR